MRIRSVLVTFLLLILSGSAQNQASPRDGCVPAYAVLDEALEIPVGAWKISFKLLVVGCEKGLRMNWPPGSSALERELAPELQEPHPVQTLLLIRDRSPELRQRLTKRINKVLGKPVVQDVFLFDAKAAESI